MRYVLLPPAIMFRGARIDVPTVVRQAVAVDARWRDEWAEQWADASAELSALDGALPGSYWRVTDETHERVSASLKSVGVPVELMAFVLPCMHAVTRAARELPDALKPKKEDVAQAS